MSRREMDICPGEKWIYVKKRNEYMYGREMDMYGRAMDICTAEKWIFVHQ